MYKNLSFKFAIGLIKVSFFLAIPLLLIILISSTSFGQNSPSTLKKTEKKYQAKTQAEREILTTDDKRLDALRQGNPEPLRQIYADDYQLVTPSGVIRSKSDQINDLISGYVKYVSIELKERNVRVYGNVAIVLSRENLNILQGGKQVGGDTYLTRTYKKTGTQWHVISTHGCFVKKGT